MKIFVKDGLNIIIFFFFFEDKDKGLSLSDYTSLKKLFNKN